jgi:FkbM family methyltransferase
MDWTGKNIWDLGSHYGLFAIGLGRRAGPTGSVAAFEPNPLSYRRLALHVKRNHLGWVKTFPFAVSNTHHSQRFFIYNGLETTTSHLAYEGETWNETIPTITVESVCLDELVANGKIETPDFIKLDVEGHGHKALDGARETITRARPVILAGMHSEPEITGITNLLLPLGYRFTPAVKGSTEALVPGFDYIFDPLPL